MGDQNIIVEITAKTEQFEQGFKKIDLATTKTIKGVTYFFAEASKKALTFEDSLNKVTRGILKFESIGQEVCNVLNNAFGQLAKGAVAPLKINIDESATAFEKFFANIANGLIDLVGKVVVQGGIFAGLISLLNAIPPPMTIGTAFAKWLAGGTSWGDLGGFFKGIGGLGGGGIKGSKHSGGEILETGLYRLLKGEIVINPDDLAKRLGAGLRGALGVGFQAPQVLPQLIPALASAAATSPLGVTPSGPSAPAPAPVVNIAIAPELDGIIKVVKRLSPAGRQRLGREVRLVVAKDKEAD